MSQDKFKAILNAINYMKRVHRIYSLAIVVKRSVLNDLFMEYNMNLTPNTPSTPLSIELEAAAFRHATGNVGHLFGCAIYDMPATTRADYDQEIIICAHNKPGFVVVGREDRGIIRGWLVR